MDPQSLVIVLRMAERILGVLLGGLLIYFAYRLFLNLPSKRGRESGSGDFSFAGGYRDSQPILSGTMASSPGDQAPHF